MKSLYQSFLAISLVLLIVASVSAERVQENYTNGNRKLDYTRSVDGKKHGPYSEFFESGQRKLQANYKQDLLHGKYAEWDENGTQALLTTGGDLAVLAFRGTESDDLTDIVVDAKFLPVDWRTAGRVHGGFGDVLNDPDTCGRTSAGPWRK